MNQSITTTSNSEKSALTRAFSKNGMFSIGGISLPEIAVLGAAGYVLWKNRSEIESLLEKGGVQVPTIMKADMNELIATSAAFIARSKRAFAEAEGHAFDSQTTQASAPQANNSMNATNYSKPATSGAAQFASKESAAKKPSTSLHDA